MSTKLQRPLAAQTTAISALAAQYGQHRCTPPTSYPRPASGRHREVERDHAPSIRVPSLSTYEYTTRATNGSATEATHLCGKLPLFAANGGRNRLRLA
jgi:hypothetical protein